MDTTGAPVPATAVILPFLALITLILDIPPLVWHIRNHNLAASSLVFWIGINNLFNFINPIIWPTDDLSKWFQGYGLCDIEVKIIPASYIGVIGSLLGIMRNLAQVLDTRNTTLGPSQARKTRQRAINIFLCFGFPCIIMLFHYIVQARRYSIVTVMGCYTTYHLSWMSIVLIFMWPLLLSLIVVYYCSKSDFACSTYLQLTMSVLLVYRMRKYREEFSSVLSSSSSNLTKNRFMRLFIISATLIIVLIPTQTYILLEFARQIDVPWSWSSAHGPHWGDITLMPLGGVVGPEYWIQIVAGLLIFAFFGTGQDAQEQYRQWLLKLGLGRLFPALHLSSSERRHLKSSTSSQTSSFGSQMRILRKGLGRSSSNAQYV